MEQEDSFRPTPAPRRLYPECRKTEYENVSIDLINKDLNINSENIQINSSCSEKVPNNKVFLLYPSLPEDGEKITNHKSILTETNDLYGSSANENVPIYSLPKPAPRPRKTQNSDIEIYENTTISPLSSASPTLERTSGAGGKEAVTTSTAVTGSSVGKVLRKAPELPPKTYLNLDQERERERCERYSISSEVSTTSSRSCPFAESYDLRERNVSNWRTAHKASNTSLADSTESSENSKYKSPSPGYVPADSHDNDNDDDDDDNNNNEDDDDDDDDDEDDKGHDEDGEDDDEDGASGKRFMKYDFLSETNADKSTNIDKDLLRTLGTTSKLLTESIGERVASKAKGARHKLDKNIKSSTDVLSNIGLDATNRLKRFGTNFTLTKKDRNRSKENMPAAQFDADRPQTMPPNDQVFNTISFSSPLARKAGGMHDLTAQGLDHSYEVPRSLKLANNEVGPLAQEDALKTSPKDGFVRSVPSSKKLMVPKHVAEEVANIARAKQERAAKESSSESSDCTSKDSPHLSSKPMPSFPAPVLPKEPKEPTGAPEAIYGKLNPIHPPARQKRRKNYDEIQLRKPPPPAAGTPTSSVGGISLRVNVDSAELHQLNADAVAAEREESLLLRERIKAEEESAPIPDRSDSWEYYEDHSTNGSETSSPDPEPLYVNNEMTYGNVFEMATSTRDILTPQNGLGRISEEAPQDAGAVGGVAEPPKEVIQEFDPLVAETRSTLGGTDKSNQLLLLEYLLEEDVYGTLKGGSQSKSDDDISMYTSEEDNLVVAAKPRPDAPQKSLPKLTTKSPSSTLSNQMQIVHQNAHLLSDSTENILDDPADMEAKVKPYLSRTEEKPSASEPVDLARVSQNRSNWFVPDVRPGPASHERTNPFNKVSIEEGESPPSYLEAIGGEGKLCFGPSEQKSRAARFMNTMNVFSNVRMRVDALKRKTSFKVSQKSDVKITLQMVPRPSISPLLVRYEGPLIRFPSGVVEDILKEMQNRKAILRDRQFQTFLEQEMKTPKEAIPLECITTLQCVSNSRVTDNSTHFYCFEITTAVPKNGCSSNVQALSSPNLIMTSGSSGNCKHQRVSHLYGVGKESERGVWMQKLLESLTNTIPTKYTCHYYRAGWCYLKNSITSEWSGTWLVLRKTQRRLIFVTEATMNVEKMDLRKARCIVLKDNDDTIKNLHVESGPMLMIDAPPFTVYLIMSSPRETKIWRHIIREVAHNNGFSLADQQLTKFNVPVIVDKCINFVYIHGSMSEGIYRKSGSENSILKLMSAFRADAFNVEITRNEYNEHDVANVLKRFMRDLPERLMGKLSESFMCVTELKEVAERIQLYKELLARLSVIERETLKKIVGHLAFISSQKAKNKMNIQNLTMIWGPTLLQNHQTDEMVYSQKEADVLTDLVVYYKNLFPLSPDELKKEQEMLLCLQKYYAAAETLTDSVKKSGDLKMWITLNPNPENTTEEKEQVNVTISPTKTAYEICKELAGKMEMSTHQVTLHEVILNGSLERPLHHDTKVFDVVLNWSYWPEDDRKNNILVVKPIDVLHEVQRAVKNLATLTPSKELKFADSRTKSFKAYQCELRDGKIVVSKKDKNDKTTIVREIFLHSTTAYLGCEKKREFPWSWAITFVERTQTQILRSRDAPYIGHVLAGSEWVDRTIWYSSIWHCLYGDSILPPAEIIIN